MCCTGNACPVYAARDGQETLSSRFLLSRRVRLQFDARQTCITSRESALLSDWHWVRPAHLQERTSATSSSRASFPSAIASPTAVDVKLLLSENSMCWTFRIVRSPPTFGHDMTMTHQHEAVHGVDLASAASTNARIADEEMPCFSGLLRGSFPAEMSAAGQTDPAHKSNNTDSVVFMTFTQ